MNNVKTNNRSKFIGFIDTISKCGKQKNKYAICITDIINKQNDKYFRDHVHIIISKAQYNKFQEYKQGQMLEFTAEIYKYNKINKETFITKEKSGLRHMKKERIIDTNESIYNSNTYKQNKTRLFNVRNSQKVKMQKRINKSLRHRQ